MNCFSNFSIAVIKYPVYSIYKKERLFWLRVSGIQSMVAWSCCLGPMASQSIVSCSLHGGQETKKEEEEGWDPSTSLKAAPPVT